ncbi:galactokinase [Nocardiopsis lambiniae]|uniref:Galactokinase n=1 Tax=Nocardiopsis lambiniae TaxID=3075539 RepID=A0ABU2M3B3_9ACTN|nr:galactokinase [Nocardiopsis sp. DSM 44743]MDT0327138.1 galactokinase [Nocardiopsis sp. DSM 44743]
MRGFREAFGYAPAGVWRAPGRINVIGEHTDYNDGFVLPVALPHAVTAAASPRDDGRLRFRSGQTDRAFDADVLPAPGTVTGWAAYPAGALWALADSGRPGGGLDLYVDGTIPAGAGLSSSAALVCATLLAACGDTPPAREETARLAQRAENDFVGMPCGIMDQSASMLAREGHALFLDVRTLIAEHVPFDPAAHGLTLMVVDTRAPHRLVDGAYAERRRTCEEAARLLGVSALRDVTDLPGALAALPDERTRRRVRHVVTENARVLEAVALLRVGEVSAIGPLLTASHVSLRDDYEVSVPEVDAAVDTALAAGALGARITGGGFGGCVIALVEAGRADACADAVRAVHADRGFAEPAFFATVPSAGARRLCRTH